jgi:hypothetical protein
VLDHYGRVCACCGSTDRLNIDHVTGGGRAHRAQLGSSYALYRWLIDNNFPPGFQTLCLPCNVSKKDGDRCRIDHSAISYDAWPPTPESARAHFAAVLAVGALPTLTQIRTELHVSTDRARRLRSHMTVAPQQEGERSV